MHDIVHLCCLFCSWQQHRNLAVFDNTCTTFQSKVQSVVCLLGFWSSHPRNALVRDLFVSALLPGPACFGGALGVLQISEDPVQCDV